MSRAQHTPGPWRVSTVGLMNDGGRAVVADDFRVAVVDCHTKFKRGEGWMAECDTRDANARLIAAAPDLLAALEKVANTYLPEDYREGCLERTLGDIARAAIAKAKGGSGMTPWNFNMDEAPRGETRMVKRTIGKNEVEVAKFIPAQIIAAGNDEVVTVSYWIPNEERWSMFTKAVPPMAWQPFPTHPQVTK